MRTVVDYVVRYRRVRVRFYRSKYIRIITYKPIYKEVGIGSRVDKPKKPDDNL